MRALQGLGLKRSLLQGLARAKLDDAILLYQNGRYGNAYYLAGYAVEIGLKACIAKQFVKDVIPPKGFVADIYTHQLSALAGLAGLAGDLETERKNDADFGAYWSVVTQWDESSRYEATDAASAKELIQAITDGKSGVFPWIQRFW